MNISAIVCTHNRCESLKQTVRSLQEQDYPVSQYEIIVVDNNSTDHTRLVCDQMVQTSSVLLKYVFEGQVGLSCARNTGTSHAQGVIVAFIDDDAIADRHWLFHLSRAHDEEKGAACVGGRIKLKWEVSKPEWWNPSLDNEYGVDHGTERKAITYPLFPYGSNISFKKSLFLNYEGFSTDFGRKGPILLAWEEVDLCLRIERDGGQILYEPDAIILHRINSSMTRKSFISKRSYWHGRSHAILEQHHFGKNLVQQKAKSFFRDLLRWLKGKEAPEQSGLNAICYKVGYLVQFVLSRLSST